MYKCTRVLCTYHAIECDCVRKIQNVKYLIKYFTKIKTIKHFNYNANKRYEKCINNQRF